MPPGSLDAVLLSLRCRISAPETLPERRLSRFALGSNSSCPGFAGFPINDNHYMHRDAEAALRAMGHPRDRVVKFLPGMSMEIH